MGAFRTSELRSLGGWSEDVGINEDYELNSRYRSAGFLVWFEASLRSGYLPRSGLVPVTKRYFAYGRAKGTLWAGGMRLAARHRILVVVPVVGFATILAVSYTAGPVVALLAGSSAILLVDAAGSSSPAGILVRLAAAMMTCTVAGAWWFGTIFGYLEARRSGIDHRQDHMAHLAHHRTRPPRQ
jgi:hypothetical protein